MNEFDPKFYYVFYKDMQKNNINTPKKLIEHYKNFGIKEGRFRNQYHFLKSVNFNSEIYKNNYSDLSHLNDLQLENHYINYGRIEKRNCSTLFNIVSKESIFDLNIYRNNNSDLENLNKSQLINHFKTYGKKENRIYNKEKLQNFNQTLPFYIINRHCDIKKKKRIIRLFRKSKINNYFFFEAFDETNKFVQDKYSQYLKNYDTGIIKTVTYWNEKRKLITNIGCVGLIYSTIELFKNIQDKDYVCICEDDIFLHNSFKNLIKFINIKSSDLLYFGFNNHEKRVNTLLLNVKDSKLYKLPKNDSLNFFYGTYGYICNKKFRQKIINLGLDWFLNNNSPIDVGYNIINFETDLKYSAITGEHLIVPDVSNDNSINGNRFDKDIFYQNRFINLENYNGKNKNGKPIYQSLMGGLGNQLFMVFNLISLASEYNVEYFIDSNFNDNKRQNPENWSFFKNIPRVDLSSLEDLQIIQEKNYTYDKIILDTNKKNKLQGYFQSYKYFWDYREDIKSSIYIDYHKVKIIKKKLDGFNKPILAIHIRLTDYLEKSDYHFVPELWYYKKALICYNLNLYQIILFSDDYLKATKLVEQFKINYIKASDLFIEDEEQFLMLCHSKVRICANSTFSLMSCYFNEIFGFQLDAEYIFPNIFFGNKGPKFKLDDLMLNYKFSTINCNLYNPKKKYKIAVIIYHKNFKNIYESRWIDKFKKSILQQKNCDFDIFEVNYGNKHQSIFNKDYLLHKFKHNFYVKNFITHTEAMLFLLDKCFIKFKYDFVFNTNIDDFYHTNRIEYQLEYMINTNSLVSSTGWTYITENKNSDVDDICCSLYDNLFMIEHSKFKSCHIRSITNGYHNLDENINLQNINMEIQNNNNIICHPSVCFSKELWFKYDKYGNYYRYRNDKPFEDLSLWKRLLDSNEKIGFINKNLLYYRIHKNQITQNNINTVIKMEETKTRIGVLLTEKNIEILDKSYLLKHNFFFYVLDLSESFLKNHNINRFVRLNDLDLDDIKVYFELHSDVIIYPLDNNLQILVYQINDILNYTTRLEELKKNGIYIDRSSDFINLLKIKKSNVYKKITKTKHINKNNLKINPNSIIFYTLIYKIKSKFKFQQYVKWGKNLIKNLENHILIIFTNSETLSLINDLIIENPQIHVIIKELSEFKYQKYKNKLIQNTNKKYFPNHNINYELIMIWLERHIMVKDIARKFKVNYYCHIDWGYFRDDIVYKNFCNQELVNKLKKNKIYFGLIRNDIPYLKKIVNYIQDTSNFKDNIEKIITQNIWSVGGGCSIIGRDSLIWWYNTFEDTISKFIENDIPIKDDQIILINIMFVQQNIKKFNFITEKNHKIELERTKLIFRKEYDNEQLKLSDYIYYYQKVSNINIKDLKDIKIENLNNINLENDITDEWFPFKNFLSGKCELIDDNKNMELLFKKFEIVSKEQDCNFLINKNELIKVYEIENLIKIYFNRKMNELSNNDIVNLHKQLIYCSELQHNNSLNMDVLFKLRDIYMFKIV